MNAMRSMAVAGVLLLGGVPTSPAGDTKTVGADPCRLCGSTRYPHDCPGRRAAPVVTVPRVPTAEEIAAQLAAAEEARKQEAANAAQRRAIEARERGDLEQAEREILEALKSHDKRSHRETLGDIKNRLGLAALQHGDLDAAAREFSAALQHWDHPVIRQNLEGVREQLRDRGRLEQEQRDAPVVARMQTHLQKLGSQLGMGNGFDGERPAGPTALQSGLDFAGLPARPASSPLRAEASGDASVVDLSDAKTLVVDPAKVRGVPATPAAGVDEALRDAPGAVPPGGGDPMKDPLFAAVVHEATARDLEKAERAAADARTAADEALIHALFFPNDRDAELKSDQASEQLRQAEQTVRVLRTQKHSLEHGQLMADMQLVRRDPALAAQLDAELQRIRRQELALLELPGDFEHAKLALKREMKQLQNAGAFRDSADLLARAQTDPRIRAALDRAHAAVMHDQADVLRDSTDEVARVVRELKQKLPPPEPDPNPPPPAAGKPRTEDDPGRKPPGTPGPPTPERPEEPDARSVADSMASGWAARARVDARAQSGNLAGLDPVARAVAILAATRADGLPPAGLDARWREAKAKYLEFKARLPTPRRNPRTRRPKRS